MPQESRNSPVTLIALFVAILLGAVTAFYLFGGAGDSGPVPGPTAMAPASSPTPGPTPEPITPTPTAMAEVPPTSPPSPTATPDASPTATPASMAVLAGFVSDYLGEPVAGIELYVVRKESDRLQLEVQRAFSEKGERWSAVTDQIGAFSLEVPPDTDFVVGPMVAGEPQPLVQQVRTGAAGDRAASNLSLPRPYELRGSVSDALGTLLPGIPVRFDWRPKTLLDRTPASSQSVVLTDESGRFSFRLLEPAEIRVTVDAAALPAPYLYDREPVMVREADFGGGRDFRVDLRVETGVDLQGVVVASGRAVDPGAPVAGATVSLREQYDPRTAEAPEPLETTTDAQGRFLFRRVHATAYNIVVSHPSYNPHRLSGVNAAAGQEVRVELEPFGVLAGEMIAEGIPRRTPIRLTLASPGGERELVVHPDGDGLYNYSFDGMRPGVYLMIAEADAPGGGLYGECVLSLEAGGPPEPEPLRLSPLCELKGTLIPTMVYSDIRNLSITATALGSQPEQLILGSITTPRRRLPTVGSTETGEFTIENLRSGTEYLVRAVERATDKEYGAALATGCQLEPLRIVIGGTGSIGGSARNSKGEACEGSIVELTTGLGMLETDSGDVQVRRTTVGFDGTYRFDHIPAGSARIRLAEDDRSARLIHVTREETLTINFECTLMVAVTFSFVEEGNDPFESAEQFLVTPKPGTETRMPLREINHGNPRVSLEPGTYLITRTRTMETVAFEVSPRFDTEFRINFRQGTAQ